MVQLRLKYFLIFLVFGFLSCEEVKQYDARDSEKSNSKRFTFLKEESRISNHPKIITCLTLVKEIHKNPLPKILDVRKVESYQLGHIPGAIQVWRNDFNEERNGLKSFRASKLKMEKLLSELGIENGDSLILYDDRGGVNAARLWFVLANYGFNKIRFLNGGIVKWKSLHFPLEKSIPVYNQTTFLFSNSNTQNLNIELEELLTIYGHTSLLDSRTKEEFSGEITKNGAAKGGRIPHSIRFDYSELNKISKGEDHCFREPWEILEKLNQLNIDLDKEVIVYCQSGARSALLAFYFKEILGLKKVRNYDGSWIEWSHHDELEAEKG